MLQSLIAEIKEYKKPSVLASLYMVFEVMFEISIPFIMPFSRSFAILLSSFSVSSNYMSYAESDYQTSGAVNFLILILLCGILVYLSKRKFPLLISDYVVVAIALAIIFTPLVW